MPIVPKEATRQGVFLRCLGEEIVKLREAKGWSRAALASRLGEETQRLGRWERGERTPPLLILRRLNAVLGATVYELDSPEPMTAPDDDKGDAV